MDNSEEVWKYNSEGELIYHKNGSFEEWFEYDTEINSIKYRNSYGDYFTEIYDSNNNLVKYIGEDGYEEYYEWDSENKLISTKNNLEKKNE